MSQEYCIIHNLSSLAFIATVHVKAAFKIILVAPSDTPNAMLSFQCWDMFSLAAFLPIGCCICAVFLYLSVLRTQLRDIDCVVYDCLVCLSSIWIGNEQNVVLYATLTDDVLCSRVFFGVFLSLSNGTNAVPVTLLTTLLFVIETRTTFVIAGIQ